MTSNNPLDLGVLCTLSTSIWSGRVKLPIGALNGEADPDWVRATKALVDREALKPIESIRGEARSWLSRRSLAFPIPGVTFVPTDFVPEVEAELARHADRFRISVAVFVTSYDVFMAQAQERLGDLFDPADYPAEVRTKFGFAWRFFRIGAASRTSLVSPELYQRETERFQQLIAEFRDNAVTSLRERFTELVHHLTDRLAPSPDGQRKVFRDSLVGNFEEFLDSFAQLNIAGDEDLERLVAQSRELIAGVTPKALRQDDTLRESVATDFQRLQARLEAELVDAPRRRIRRAESSPAA